MGANQSTDEKRYLFRNKIGEGSEGEVSKFLDTFLGRDVAIKKVPLSKKKQEAEILKVLNSANSSFFPRFYEIYHKKNTAHIVMEYIEGKELYDLIVERKGLDETVAKNYFLQLLEALRIIQKNNIIHRDLKPENMIVQGDKLKVVDWGYSVVWNPDDEYPGSGTASYVAPEVLEVPSTIHYANDIWSLGMVLYTMLTGTLPFDCTSTQKVFNRIMNFEIEVDHPKISLMAQNLLKKIFVPLEKRPTCEDILRHPWCRS